ncbi:MAG: carboxypeptidase M32 [Clostridiales bacterium]|nr:carboxypeptidase M32 [Clostridiales bacterium]
MNLEQAKAQLIALQAKMSAYHHAMGLLSYDGATTAPKATAANRGQTLSVLSEESYKLSTGKDTVELLEYLDAHKDELNAREARMVEILIKDIRQMQKVPMEEYVAYQTLLVEADDVWHTAKETSNFALFEPYLEKIFATTKKFAGYFAPDKDPYDFWLGEFEDGLTRESCDQFFATLRSRIVPLLKKVSEKEQVSDKCLWGHFPIDKQDELSKYLMELMGLDLTHVGLSTTEHPFTTSLGSHLDTRITTHYMEDNFASSMFSVVHEGGHALYDTGSDDDLCYTVLDGGVSMGIHESQSRFYENLIGRSLPFIRLIFPKLQELFPQQLEGYTAEDVFRAVNKAEPSLIRVEADEVTYCLHVMVRYELEKRVMAGEITVHDLPAEWNKLYKEYLGLDVPDDKHGVLQDSHWSGGAIGYFPSYALGSAYGAQLIEKMKETVDVDACIEKGDFAPINAWNREHIWHYGCLLKPQVLLEKALGAKFDPLVYCTYLENKCKAVYGLE